MKTTLLALGALAVVVSAGCDSEVNGGGGGAGGEGGAGTSVVASSGQTTTATSVATGTSSADSTATGTSSGSSGGGGQGGQGGAGGLGTCEEEGGTSVTSGPGGGNLCEASYACEGGDASVDCTDNVCDCYLDGQLEGTCEGDSNCWFPVGCCFELLGGVARPNPGPFGACEESGGTSTSGQGGGVSLCDSFYTCEGGELTISCEETEAGGATCTCNEGQGFTLGTCEQETLSCEYESSCCYAIFNP